MRLDAIIGMNAAQADAFITERGYVGLFYNSQKEMKDDYQKSSKEHRHKEVIRVVMMNNVVSYFE
jgi:hypothetical protein